MIFVLKRIITGVVGIAVLLPFIIFSDTWALVVMTSVMSVFAVCEVLRCTEQIKRWPVTVMSVGVCLTAQILPRLMESDIYTTVILLVYIAFAVILMTLAVFSKGNFKLMEATQIAVMVMYISFGFSALILLRDLESGLALMLFAFLVPWVCDAMAYFVGVFFGKHKMIPDVSPKKTVEGAVGGIIGGLLITVIFGVVMQFAFDMDTHYPMLIVLALVACLVSQWGDLIASLLKREYGVKDYGKLFPGHGGVMDRFDSIIAVSTFMYIVCRSLAGVSLF